MNSSTSSSNRSAPFSGATGLLMAIPLVQDIQAQRWKLRAFAVKLTAFVLLCLALDRLAADFLEKGLSHSYGLDIPAEVLCIGHSHTALGIDKMVLERELGVPVAKYALNGANVADRLAMIKHYTDRQPSSVKVLIYDVDAHVFTGAGLSVNSYTRFYPFMDSPSVDRYVRQHATFTDYSTRHALKLRRFDLETCNASVRGWLQIDANFKQGMVDAERLKKEIAAGRIRHISFDEDYLKCFDETLQYTAQKGIHVVLVYIPTIDLLNEAEPEKYKQAIHTLQEFAKKYGHVTLLDYCSAFAHRHDLFYDPVHLNPRGQKAVTERLAQDIKPLTTGTPGCQAR